MRLTLRGRFRDMVFENGYFGRNTPHLLMANRRQPSGLAEGFGDITGNDTRNTVRLRRFFHSGRDIDRASVDADGPLCVALLADHHFAAVHPDPEGRNDAELLQKICLLTIDS